MKVLALIYTDEEAWESLSEDERQATYARYRAFGERVGTRVAEGAELAPTRSATTVRVRDGQVLIADGPSGERSEPLGGFYLFDVDSVDEAKELAAGIPSATTGAIELRSESLEQAP